jgi:hypothetical protein
LQVGRSQFLEAVADDQDAAAARCRARRRRQRGGSEQSDDERRDDSPAIRHRCALYRTGAVAVAIGTLLTLAACGNGGSSDAGTARAAGGATVKASAGPRAGGGETATAGRAGEGAASAGGSGGGKPGRQAADGKPGAEAVSASSGSRASGCEARLGDFLDRMDDLRQSLLAGLSYDEYVVRVRAIRAAYEAVPVDKLGVACVSGPAAKAEDAFNQYLRAANAWGDCAATAGCAASEVEGKLQWRWRLASKQLDAAEKHG